MPSVRLDQWAVRSSEPVSAQTGEGLALLSTDQNEYLVLNSSAAVIWERLAEPVALQTLASGIADDFGLEAGEAAEAVLDVVAGLLAQNLVSVQDGGSK